MEYEVINMVSYKKMYEDLLKEKSEDQKNQKEQDQVILKVLKDVRNEEITKYEEIIKELNEKIYKLEHPIYIETELDADYKCPECGNHLVQKEGAIYCKGNECQFYKSINEMGWEYFKDYVMHF